MLPFSNDKPDLWSRDPVTSPSVPKATTTIPLVKPPEILHLQVTERCNFACPKCYLPELNATPARQELTPKEIETKVFIPSAEIGIERIVITGGEPFLYRGLFELVECCNRYFSEVFVGTNGFFLDEARTDRILDTEVDFIQVSLDAVTVDCLKKIMGGGAVERLWPNLEQFIRRRNQRISTTRVIVATVIDHRNIAEIPAVLDRCQAIGVDSVTLQAYHEYDTVYRADSVEWPVYAEYDDGFLSRLEDLIDQVIAAKRNGSQLFPHAEEYFRNLYTFFADRSSLRILCQADDFLFVDSRGFLRGCIFSESLGHVDNGILAYLTSPAYHRFLTFKQDCRLCTHGCAYRPPMD